MVYIQPYIDRSGLHTSTYQDIEDYLVALARRCFGNDIYLGPDSQDFQWIAGISQLHYDGLLAARLAYENRSPMNAIGTALDGLAALSGIERKGSAFSTVTVTLTGVPGTVITNGIVADENGAQWNLPTSTTIGVLGNVSVTATAQQRGIVTALVGQVKFIVTPTFGWTAVINPFAAVPGQPVEEDSQFRARQVQSVANPSQALTTGTLGGVLNVPGVVSAQLYENDTPAPVERIDGVKNPDDFPANSMTFVVDGGDGQAIAEAISVRKTPGCFLPGDQIYTIYDRFSVPKTIRFYRPTDRMAFFEIDLRSLPGYTSATRDAIKQALADYTNSLVAGRSLINSELWQAILNSDKSKVPLFSLRAVRAYLLSGAPTTDDIELYFNERAITDFDNVTINVVS